MEKKAKHFLHQPEYPGGPKAMAQFIYEKLRYPKAAIEAGIEGTVLVEYDIDFRGNVIDARVKQALGYGCDEEAVRVVKMLKFEVGKNRGVKVVFHKKTHIQFKRPQNAAAPQAVQQINYQYVTTPKKAPEPQHAEKKQQVVYTISIEKK